MSVSSLFTFPLRFAEQVKLNNLSECNCCPRHQLNKPSELKPWVELKSWEERQIELNPNHVRDMTCQCDCRHKARWRTLCSVCATGARVARPVPCNS